MSKAGGGESKNTLFAPSAARASTKVRKLIAGPTVFICDECVRIVHGDHPGGGTRTSFLKSRDGVPSPARDFQGAGRLRRGPASRQEKFCRSRFTITTNASTRPERAATSSLPNRTSSWSAHGLREDASGGRRWRRILDVPFTMADATTLTEAG